jgi:hypothetical protein
MSRHRIDSDLPVDVCWRLQVGLLSDRVVLVYRDTAFKFVTYRDVRHFHFENKLYALI